MMTVVLAAAGIILVAAAAASTFIIFPSISKNAAADHNSDSGAVASKSKKTTTSSAAVTATSATTTNAKTTTATTTATSINQTTTAEATTRGSVTYLVSTTVQVAPRSNGTATSFCDDNDGLFTGGYIIGFGSVRSADDTMVFANSPVRIENGTSINEGWQTGLVNMGRVNATITSNAICLNISQ